MTAKSHQCGSVGKNREGLNEWGTLHFPAGDYGSGAGQGHFTIIFNDRWNPRFFIEKYQTVNNNLSEQKGGHYGYSKDC
jgi:hypothetical protein